MNIDGETLDAQYERARKAWPFIELVEAQYHLPRLTLYAVGSRETNLTNEVGDGGHGHGVWQLDNRSHDIPPGFDANVELQAVRAAGMLAALRGTFGGDARAAFAAYNAGAGTVEYNLAHGLDIDTGTAHGDYSIDVAQRLAWLQAGHTDPAIVLPGQREDDTMPTIYENADDDALHLLGTEAGIMRLDDNDSAMHDGLKVVHLHQGDYDDLRAKAFNHVAPPAATS